MNKYFTIVLLILVHSLNAQTKGRVEFRSSDLKLKETFDWAKMIALSYSHDGNDSVGYWYEAALPKREAFCMRDVSHQSIGAEILGLSLHNFNMLHRFAENISESKDWCSYWEINRNNRPAPVDYVDDKQFWYNLDASFDVVQDCYRLYNWTGNKAYLFDTLLVNFYEKTLNEYVERWKLEPENIMIRSPYLNTELPFQDGKKFNQCRGIPSYVEDIGGFSIAGDLISAIYAGFSAYSKMLTAKGENEKSKEYLRKAEAYKVLLNEKWWDRKENHYNFFWSSTIGEFLKAETLGETYIVWFNASSTPERSRITLNRVLNGVNNAENLSHLPYLLYRCHMPEKAYEMLLSLKDMKRSDYPEVSYGAIEGIIAGVMGVQPVSYEGKISTLSQLSSETEWAEVDSLPVFNVNITVRHEGLKKTEFTNQGKTPVTWQASFYGAYPTIKLGNKEVKALTTVDEMGNIYSFVQSEVLPGNKKTASINGGLNKQLK